MYKALVLKELRETAGIAVIALLAYLAGIMNLLGYPVLPFGFLGFIPRYAAVSIPFLDNQFYQWFIVISVGFVIAIGLRQTVGESVRGTWLLLMHRPLERRNLIAVKLAVGTALYLTVSALAILIYAAWAATPGTHASPFYWWMSVPCWQVGIIVVLGYLGAFFAGVRPGRWFGTRLLPLAAAAIMAFLVGSIVIEMGLWFLGFIIFAFLCAAGVGLILYVARTRDYS
jgi:hypothetical protein